CNQHGSKYACFGESPNATNTVASTLALGNHPTGLALSPDGSKMYIPLSGDGLVDVISTATNTIINSFSISKPEGISVSADGSLLYVPSWAGDNVNVYNSSTLTQVAPMPGFS